MNIHYEEMQKSDYNRIMELITQAWFSEYNFSKRVISLYAKGYLYMYLSELSYKQVAKDGGKVVGFLFGRCDKVNPFKALYYKTKLFFVGLNLLFTKAGRRGLKINHKTNVANKALFKDAKIDDGAELVLFIVDEAYRGCGIGSTLEKNFYTHAKKSKKDTLYLYTDTYSNYEFYENKDYTRQGEVYVDFNLPHEENGTYYIYTKELSENEDIQERWTDEKWWCFWQNKR